MRIGEFDQLIDSDKPFEWVFNMDAMCLDLFVKDKNPRVSHLQYDINLEDCRTSAALLDWIFQVASKPWATQAIIGQMILDLQWLLDPQANLCGGALSSGSHGKGPINIRAVLSKHT